jgi:hypothetical protein
VGLTAGNTHAGLQFSLQAGVEAAYYVGPEKRTQSAANSFQGIFHTAEGTVAKIWGPVDPDLAHYVGEKDQDGGRWYGGSAVASLGPPGMGYVGWNYTRVAGRDLLEVALDAALQQVNEVLG